MIAAGMAPYPGLRAYRREESVLFFGREGCVDEMVDRLAATRFLAVLGTSGSGKSSLVRTGLLDALKIGLHPAGTRWMIADCHPGGRPTHNLARGLLSAKGVDKPEPEVIEALETFLRRGPRSVAQWVDANVPRGQNLLLIVDQFEELFRYGDHAGRERAESFVALLLECARSTAPVHVVITMRSEYLGACALIPGLAEQINKGLYLTRRMTRDECREAIEGPADVTGFTIEPKLVTRILNDLSSFAPWDPDREDTQLERLSRQADQLPLMQHALSRLWHLARKRDEDGPVHLTLADYESIGELSGALDQHGDEVVASLSDAAKPLVRPVFRALVAGTNLSDAVRKPTRLRELVAIVGVPRQQVAEVVEAFRAPGCSFLRPPPQQPLEDDTVVDISHESLIRQWSSLAAWLGEEARAEAMWTRLTDAEARHARGEGEVLVGADLSSALDWWSREQPTAAWAKAHGGEIGRIKTFLDESRNRAEAARRAEDERLLQEKQRLEREIERDRVQRDKDARTNTRLRVLLGLALASLVGAAGGGVTAYWQYQTATEQATRAEASEKVALANATEADKQKKAAEASAKAAEASEKLAVLNAEEAERLKVDAQTERDKAIEASRQLKESTDSLARERDRLTAANDDLKKTKDDLERASEEAKAATDKSFKATDDFIIREADRRIQAPGVSLADAERSLEEGRAFLTGMSVVDEDRWRQELIVSRMDLRLGMAKSERGDFDAALALFRAAEQQLDIMSQRSEQSALAIAERAAAFRLQSEVLSQKDELEAAETAASSAVGLLAGLTNAENVDVGLERARADSQLASVRAERDNVTGAAEAATRCLATLGAAKDEDSAERVVERARCALIATRTTDAPADEERKRLEGTLASLDKLTGNAQSVQARMTYAAVAKDLAELARRADDPGGERDNLVRAYMAVDLGPDDEKQRVRLRQVVADTEARRALAHLAAKEYDLALDRARHGVEMLLLGAGSGEPDDWNATSDITRTYNLLLRAQLDTLEAQGTWRQDANGIDRYLKAASRRLETIPILAPGCADCLMGARWQVYQALLALSRSATSDVAPLHPVAILKDPDKWYKALRETIGFFETQGKAQQSDAQAAASARNYWLTAVLAQFEQEGDLPNLNVNQRIQKLTDARRTLEAYLAVYPQAWQVERKVGRIDHSLALAFNDVGNQTEALKAAESGAKYFSRDAVALLAKWYRDGDGAVAADEAAAQRYEKLLSSRGWGIAIIDVTADYLWTAEDDAAKTTLVIEDKISPDDPVVTRIVEQAHDQLGMVLSQADTTRLRAIEQAATAASDSFLELAKRDMSKAANSPDWLALVIEPVVTTLNIEKLSNAAIDQSGKTGGLTAFYDAVRLLVERSADPVVADNVFAFAKDKMSNTNWSGVCEALLTIVIDRARFTPAQLAEAYKLRAKARENLSNPNRPGAESDRLIALALVPSDVSTLNSVAYDWANAERDLKASIELLRRAVEAEPNNPFVRDSLGWAYVQAGDLEKGRELIESALSEQPKEGEIIAHSAEIDRRQGRETLAREKFMQALALTNNAGVQSFIIGRQQLLTDASGVSRDYVMKAAELLRQTIPTNRVGWSTDEIGIAIRGFDPVAYFTKKRPELGSIEHLAVWNDALWLFSNAEHLEMFKAAPEKYAPAFGGFCAFCVASNHKLHSNPVAWAVFRDRLYLHYTLDYRDSWLRDPDGYIADAGTKWPALVNKVTDPDARSAFTSRIADAMAAD